MGPPGDSRKSNRDRVVTESIIQHIKVMKRWQDVAMLYAKGINGH